MGRCRIPVALVESSFTNRMEYKDGRIESSVVDYVASSSTIAKEKLFKNRTGHDIYGTLGMSVATL